MKFVKRIYRGTNKKLIKTKNMKTILLSYMKSLVVLSVAVFGLSFGLTGCQDEFDFKKAKDELDVENFFDFSTVQNPEVSLSIKNQGFGEGVTSSVFFGLYTENPLVKGIQGSVGFNNKIKPIYSNFTADDGTWSGVVEMPAYAKTVYAVYMTVGGWQVLEAEITGNKLVLDDSSKTKSFATRPTRAGEEYKVIVLESKSNPQNDWDTQLMIPSAHTFVDHNYFQFSMWIRADVNTEANLTLNNKKDDGTDGWVRTVKTDIKITTEWQQVWFDGNFGGPDNDKTVFTNGSQFVLHFNKTNQPATTYYIRDIQINAWIGGDGSTSLISQSISNTNVGGEMSGWWYTDKNGNGTPKVQLYKPNSVNEPNVEGKMNLYTDAIFATQNDSKNGNYKSKAWKEWLGRYSTTGCALTEQEIINDLNNPANYHSHWTSYNGGIEYANQFSSEEVKNQLSFTAAQLASIVNAHNAYMVNGSNVEWEEDRYHNWQSVCPKEVRTTGDMKVSEDSPVSITMLLNYSNWANSLAYYYYEDGKQPSSINQITPILITPCTLMYPNNTHSDFKDDDYNSVNYTAMPVGTTVQLYYFGPSDQMSKDKKSAIFPAGTKIGFLLKTHAWQGDNFNAGGTPALWETSPCVEDLYRSSTPGLLHPNGTNWYDPQPQSYMDLDNAVCGLGVNHSDGHKHTCGHGGSGCAEYEFADDKTRVVVSFEDHTNDENYNDVAFIVKSTKPFGDVPEVEVTATVNVEGSVYSFEDLWPSEGDYDMNDVMLDVTESADLTLVKQNGVTKGSFIEKQTITFTPYENYASNQNGFAVRMSVIGNSSKKPDLSELNITIKGKKIGGGKEQVITNYQRVGDVIFITENIQEYCYSTRRAIKTPGYITIVVNYPEKTYDSQCRLAFEPFIFKRDETDSSKTWEVHLPNREPSSINVDYQKTGGFTYFNQGGENGDKSRPAEGYYYVRNGDYPFAIQWKGTHIRQQDIPAGNGLCILLAVECETLPIDKVFPSYKDWVSGKGNSNQAWYLENIDIRR